MQNELQTSSWVSDVHPKLGFALAVETAENMVDLLTGDECLGEELLQ